VPPPIGVRRIDNGRAPLDNSPRMRATILSIGDELTLGQTVDTNSAWLAQQLAAIGYRPAAHLTVPDDRDAIRQAFEECVGRCDALIVSGGLGPTEDDLTRQALSDFLGAPLELVPAALENVERFFRALRREMPDKNRIQAMLPRGAEMIENTAGTAPGIYCDYLSGDQKTVCKIFIMPGVPKEMKIMFERSVRPKLAGMESGRAEPVSSVILSKTLHTFGLGESAVGERLGDLMRRDRNPSVGTTVANGYVSLRLNAYFPTRAEAERQLAETEQACRAALGDLIWGEQDQTLSEVVGRLLAASRKSVTAAETCTGGLLAKLITDVAGSSAYFRQGWITYSNDAKSALLGVRPETLQRHGAVSEPTVSEMATGARDRADADYALAISGVAGPEGGTPDKPVGTVSLALHARGETPPPLTRTFIFHGDREMVRDRSAKMALTMLRFHLLGKPLPF
jgi:nicotinamide-nucleotide amidase